MNALFRPHLCVAAAFLALASAARAQAPKEPSWPQQFQVLQGENASFGFVVSQPGPISVSVNVQGAPVSVELSGPIAQPMRKSGTGSINITIAATAADVQKSAIWLVRISPVNLAQPAPNHAPQAVASGTITVQHPPGKMSIAQAPTQHRPAAVSRSAVMPGTSAASLMATYEAQLAAKQKAEQERLQRMISATPVAANTGRPPVKRMQTGPVIKSLSVSTGQPGDFLLINGSGFAYGDEVHFIVAPGMDLKATVNAVGSDTVIMVNVPSVAGVGSYAGQIYVQSTGQNAKKSAGIHFDFVPTMEFVDLAPVETQPDAHIDRTDLASVCPGDRGVCRDGSNDFLGHKGDDIWYATMQLKGGWIVHEVNAGPFDVEGFGGAGASVSESRVGTSYPYAKVHWWMDALTSFRYAVIVIIKGPKGVPYQ